ncbi:methyltransferase [Micrococcus luteus]|nr:methyltransferase [Micrococcus luteus]
MSPVPTPPSPPAPRLTPATAVALAADLAALPFTTAAVEGLLGPVATRALDREHAEAARRVVAGHLAGPGDRHGMRGLAAAVGAWLLGDSVPAADLDAALPSLGLSGAVAAGLVVEGPDGRVRGAVDLSPYEADEPGRMWIASDLTALQRRGPLPPEHVLGVGRASLTLAGATQRRPVARALDVGVGCGIQTLHLLAHADHVTATDLSERALAFTRFNLLLNADVLGLDRERLEDRVRLAAGDLLAPVAGERFDLVVSNPPFVITPRTDPDAPVLTYRDGGREGDRIVAELIAALPDVLAEGGTAQLLANWEIPAGDTADADTAPWDARPRSWVAPGMQAWFLQRDRQDPAGYAETWLQDSSLELDPPAYEAAYRGYLEDFDARGVAGVGFGHVWLRRPAADGSQGRGWVVAEELTQPVDEALGGAWAAAVARRDRLAAGPGAGDAVGDPALAALRGLHLRVAADVTEERHQRFGAEHPEVILARQGSGFRRVARLDTATAGVLSASDGELSVGQLVGAVAALLELDEAGRAGLLAALRELHEDGFLVEG